MQFNLCHDVMRSIAYFRHIAGLQSQTEALTYAKNVFLEHAVINWAKLFGNYSEDTHWTKVANHTESKITQLFDKNVILTSVSLEESEWYKYHKNMTVLRNQFFAHFNTSSYSAHIPSLEPALLSTYAYREWLSKLIDAAKRNRMLVINNAEPNEVVISIFKATASEAFGDE